MYVALGQDAEVLIDVRPPPGVIVNYVGIELVTRPRQSEEVWRIEEGGNVSERFRWDAEQNVGCPACSVGLVVCVSIFAGFGGVLASRFVSILSSGMSFDGPTGHKTR